MESMIPVEQLSEAERKWIASCDTLVNGYNLAEGGDGGNLLVDPEVKRRHKDNHNTAEYLDGQSKRSKKMWSQPGFKEQQSLTHVKQHKDPEFKKRHSEGVSNSWVKRKANGNTASISRAQKAVYQRPGQREKMSAIINSEEVKQKMSASMKATYSKMTAEAKSNRVKKAWETRRAKAKAEA
tara:strand:+ start:392 stop:937 length:546 start_codon:yes stop_codon:yes gene_type:complete